MSVSHSKTESSMPWDSIVARKDPSIEYSPFLLGLHQWRLVTVLLGGGGKSPSDGRGQYSFESHALNTFITFSDLYWTKRVGKGGILE